MNPRDKFYLFRKTNNFCAAPWNLIYVDVDGSVKICVKGNDYFGNLQTNTIEEILANPKIKKIKTTILNDKTSIHCASCQAMENDGVNNKKYSFLRNNYNELARDIDINYQDTDQFVLGALDLHWSSLCDLKCVTCWAKQSSSIAVEQGLPVQHLPTEHALKFIDWVVNHQDTLKEIYLSGGEPTLIKYNARLLEQINKRDDLVIRVNSNMMWDLDNNVIKEILKFPNVLFTCSADGIGSRFDYIRRGASWIKFQDRLKFLLEHSNVSVRINSVFSVLNASTLVDLIDYFKHNFQINSHTINQCGMGHTQLKSRNLPDTIKQITREKINDAINRYSLDINLVGQLKNCLVELEYPPELSYVSYLDGIDKLEKTNWREIFTDLK